MDASYALYRANKIARVAKSRAIHQFIKDNDITPKTPFALMSVDQIIRAMNTMHRYLKNIGLTCNAFSEANRTNPLSRHCFFINVDIQMKYTTWNIGLAYKNYGTGEVNATWLIDHCDADCYVGEMYSGSCMVDVIQQLAVIGKTLEQFPKPEAKLLRCKKQFTNDDLYDALDVPEDNSNKCFDWSASALFVSSFTFSFINYW
jgi:hypothetical protein